MNEVEKLKRDINSIKESVRLHWWNLAEKHMSAEERISVRKDIVALNAELEELIGRLDELEQRDRDN